jgi:hypothetical protein
MRANKNKTKKVPKAQAGMAIGAVASAVPQALAAWQGYKAQKEAKAEAASLKAMMPSMTSQEDYYNYYQKQSQLLNQSKLQNQMDQSLAAGAKTLQNAGSRGVLGGTQGMVGQAQSTKADLTQQQGQQLLGAYEKMIGAKEMDRQRILGQVGAAQQMQTAGMATMLQGLQGLGDTALSAGLEYDKIQKGYYDKNSGGNSGGNSSGSGGTSGKEGMTIEKTPGEFSHEKNPIDVVQDGTKIAEMTGGEYIFNPKQMAAIKKLVAESDGNKLHSYMKSIIKKFEKKAKA